MEKFMITTEDVSGFFGIEHQEVYDKTLPRRWSGAMIDFNVGQVKDNEANAYALTGIGCFLCLPFLEKVNKSDVTAYMVKIQSLCTEGNILEAIENDMVAESDRQNLLWLIDRVILEDVSRYRAMRDRVKSAVLPDACFYCGARVGEIHRYFHCEDEPCPFCGQQTVVCDCSYEQLGLIDDKQHKKETDFLPPDVYENGLSDEQHDQWRALCEAKGRIPYQGDQR